MAAKKKRRSGPAKNWNLLKVKAKQAFNLLSRDEYGAVEWGDIEVAHIDTGYTKHPVFGDFDADGTHLMLDSARNYFPREDEGDSIDPLDYSANPGHGSRIGSVICGLPIHSKFCGGVAPSLPLIPYRATKSVVIGLTSKGKRYRLNVAEAIMHAVDHNDANVINISLGTPMLSPFGSRPLGKAVDYAYERGVIVCAAAGQITDRVSYPGKFYRTIGCGGMEHDDTIWNTADQTYDPLDLVHIDVWAPANDIHRPKIELDDDGNLKTGIYSQSGSGTSYATAHTSAAAAMWLAYHGEEIDRQYGNNCWMRVEAFRHLIKTTSGPLSGDQQPYPGTGILNIHALLKADLPQPGALQFESRKAEDMGW